MPADGLQCGGMIHGGIMRNACMALMVVAAFLAGAFCNEQGWLRGPSAGVDEEVAVLDPPHVSFSPVMPPRVGAINVMILECLPRYLRQGLTTVQAHAVCQNSIGAPPATDHAGFTP